MSTSVDIFFALLRSGLYGRPVPEDELPQSIDWPAVVDLAKKQAVYGVIIEAAQMLPERLRPDAATSANMAWYAMGLIKTNLTLDHTLARLVAHLRSHGIEGVLLKGQGVARYYRQPQMRQCGDIDFYVGKEMHRQAVEACRGICPDMKPYVGVGQHFDFHLDGVTIEMHRKATRIYLPWRDAELQAWVEEMLERSADRRSLSICDVDITVPPLEFDVIYIFYHAWRHYLQFGIGVRQLCDWTMALYSHIDEIDTERLTAILRRFGMVNGWRLFGYIAVNYLGLPTDKMPLYDPGCRRKAEKVLNDILVGGNFGFHSQAYDERLRLQGNGLDRAIKKLYYVTKYYCGRLALSPKEVAFMYLHHITNGMLAFMKKSENRMD